jgi:hypothetical protein
MIFLAGLVFNVFFKPTYVSDTTAAGAAAMAH